MRFSTFTIFAITVSLIAAAPVYTNTSEDALVVRSSPDAAKVDTEDSTASQSGNIESDTKPKTISLNEWLEEGPKILKTLGEVKNGIVEAKKEKKIGNTKANTMVQYVNTATLAIERLINFAKKRQVRREETKSLHHLETGKNMAQDSGVLGYFYLI